MKYGVDISHLDEPQLNLYGYDIVFENETHQFIVHRPTGHEQVVLKSKPILIVEDMNDAQQMSKNGIFQFPF